jgi:hypothetical protein
MIHNKKILCDYLDNSLQYDIILEASNKAKQNGSDTQSYEYVLNKLSKKLGYMEDANPWLANVLTAMKGT